MLRRGNFGLSDVVFISRYGHVSGHYNFEKPRSYEPPRAFVYRRSCKSFWCLLIPQSAEVSRGEAVVVQVQQGFCERQHRRQGTSLDDFSFSE